jgi:hypothetical protein
MEGDDEQQKKKKKNKITLWPCLEERMLKGKMEFWESIDNLFKV